MSPDDSGRPDGLSDFDVAGIDQAVADWQPVERPSQRRAARQLVPLIERILAVRPDLPTAQVRKILEANRRSGPLPNTATFNRELGAICNEVRSGLVRSSPPARVVPTRSRTASRSKSRRTIPTAQGASASGTGEAGPVPPTPAMPAIRPVALPAPSSARHTHPLDLFEGKFAGKVFVHTPVIRAFFSAIDKRGDDALLARLAKQVAADAASQASLDQLHPRDRAILEAALSLP